MAKIVLDPVTNGNTLSTLNANFDKLEAELQNRVAYRDNVSGETNTIRNDMDHDGNDIFNVNTIDIQELVVQGVPVPGSDLAGLPALVAEVDALQTGLAATNVTLTNTINTVNNNAAIEDIHDKASVRLASGPIPVINEAGGRDGKFIAFDASGNPITSVGTGADLGLRTDLANDSGSNLVGWARNPIVSTINDVGLWLNAQPVDAYELANTIVSKPNPLDPTTWDWAPVFAAVNSLPAANAVQLNLPAHAINISTTAEFTRGVLVRGQGMYRSVINNTDATKYAINFVCPTTRFEYFELRGVTVNSKYGVVTRWDESVDIVNVANPFRTVRIIDSQFIGTYNAVTDPLAGTTTIATASELALLGVGIRAVMAYGALVEGCLFENFGIALANFGCTLSKFSSLRFRNNARHIHDERTDWYASSFGMGADNEYTLCDILDGRRFGAITLLNSYGTKFHGNYIEHLDRGGALSSATVFDFINPSHMHVHNNHVNGSLAFTRSQPVAKFRSVVTEVDAVNNIFEHNYLTPFDNVRLVTVDFTADFHWRYPQVLVYHNNMNWPDLYQANIMTEYPTQDVFSATNIHQKSRTGGVLSLDADVWNFDAGLRQWYIKHDTDTLSFWLRCKNPERATKFAVVFDCDDIPASGGNGRCFLTINDEDGTTLVNSQIIAGVTAPQKYTVEVNSALPYTDKWLNVQIVGSHLLKIIAIKLEPFQESVRSKTYTPGTIVANSFVATTVSVPGADIGDFVTAGFNQSMGSAYAVATVSAADTVTVRIINPTASDITPAAGRLYARVVKSQIV